MSGSSRSLVYNHAAKGDIGFPFSVDNTIGRLPSTGRDTKSTEGATILLYPTLRALSSVGAGAYMYLYATPRRREWGFLEPRPRGGWSGRLLHPWLYTQYAFRAGVGDDLKPSSAWWHRAVNEMGWDPTVAGGEDRLVLKAEKYCRVMRDAGSSSSGTWADAPGFERCKYRVLKYSKARLD